MTFGRFFDKVVHASTYPQALGDHEKKEIKS
jgi:hypothetical protein